MDLGKKSLCLGPHRWLGQLVLPLHSSGYDFFPSRGVLPVNPLLENMICPGSWTANPRPKSPTSRRTSLNSERLVFCYIMLTMLHQTGETRSAPPAPLARARARLALRTTRARGLEGLGSGDGSLWPRRSADGVINGVYRPQQKPTRPAWLCARGQLTSYAQMVTGLRVGAAQGCCGHSAFCRLVFTWVQGGYL